MMHRMSPSWACALCLFGLIQSHSAAGTLVVDSALSHDMVLPTPEASIWGTASAGATISTIVTRGSLKIQKTAVADARGSWLVNVSVSASLTPATIEIIGDS